MMENINNGNNYFKKLVRSKYRKLYYNNIQLLVASSLKQHKKGKGKRFKITNEIISSLKG